MQAETTAEHILVNDHADYTFCLRRAGTRRLLAHFTDSRFDFELIWGLFFLIISGTELS